MKLRDVRRRGRGLFRTLIRLRATLRGIFLAIMALFLAGLAVSTANTFGWQQPIPYLFVSWVLVALAVLTALFLGRSRPGRPELSEKATRHLRDVATPAIGSVR